MNTKNQQMYEDLKKEYEGNGIPDEDLQDFAEELYNHVFVEKGSIVEVMALVDNFENELTYNDIEIDISQGWSIFNDIVDMLDVDSENAERLYKTFLEFRDFNVFNLLMTTYSEWLTDDKKREVMEIAMGEFDKTLMKAYQ